MTETLPKKESPRDPVQNADAEARAEALGLLQTGHAALAWTDPDTGTPLALSTGFLKKIGIDKTAPLEQRVKALNDRREVGQIVIEGLDHRRRRPFLGTIDGGCPIAAAQGIGDVARNADLDAVQFSPP